MSLSPLVRPIFCRFASVRVWLREAITHKSPRMYRQQWGQLLLYEYNFHQLFTSLIQDRWKLVLEWQVHSVGKISNQVVKRHQPHSVLESELKSEQFIYY